MKKTLFLGANWKMNPIPMGALAADSPFRSSDDCTVMVFPSFLDIQACLDAGLRVGAQWGRAERQGAFTGDISIEMLRRKGCVGVLCGHSERRKWHGETDEMIAFQVQEAIEQGMIPVLCIGETKEEKEAGRTEDVLRDQLKQIRALSEAVDCSLLKIAYEPVWAIGTGVLPSPSECQKIHAFIRSILPLSSIDILYGGSLKGSNAQSFFTEKDIDGGLIGGSALDCEEFRLLRQ